MKETFFPFFVSNVNFVSIFAAILLSSLLYLENDAADWLFLACGAVLIVIGVLDDKFDISFKETRYHSIEVLHGTDRCRNAQ
ncbi:MAG: hypothetical protein NWP82_05655, partial [Flavobacteriales bacterium]|nr:hypothetical protein [Flavobacteriales bacterium]